MGLRFLSRLFSVRDPLTAGGAGDRVDAIQALTAETAAAIQDQLAELARCGPDEKVRNAAIAQLQDKELLRTLLDNPDLAPAVATRMTDLGHQVNHPKIRQVLMQRAKTVGDAVQAASEATDPTELAELYLCSPGPWREELLALIRRFGEAGLSALEKCSRNRDKTSNRVARAERGQLRTLRKTVNDLSERAGELAATLSKSADDDPSPRIIQLKKELAHCCEALSASSPNLAHYGIEGPSLTPWLELTHYEQTPLNTATPTASRGFADLLAGLEQLAMQLAAGAPFTALKAQCDALTSQWLAQADQAQPSKAEHAVFEQVSHQYQELADAWERCQGLDLITNEVPKMIDEWPQEPDAWQEIWGQQRRLSQTKTRLERKLEQVRWPEWAPPSEVLKQAIDQVAVIQQFAQAASAQQEQLAEQVENAVAETDASIAEGRLQNASTALATARRLEKSLPKALPAHLKNAMARASAQVEELRGWQTFATLAKREELVQAMQALADNPIQLQEQAERIKALRRDWNALGLPFNAKERVFQGQFDQAAECAFRPCRAYFAEQNEIRHKNADACRSICEQLEDYVNNVDWRKTDMKAAEQIMRQARQEWRQLHPLDRKQVRALSTRFEKLQKTIHAEVKKTWDRNLAAKKELLANAEVVAASDEELEAKVVEIKSLQQRWRSVGITPRSADQKLWQQFREQCDLIFSTRAEKRQQDDHRTAASLSVAEDICQALERAVDAPTPDLSLVPRLREQLDDIPLPERRRWAMERRFDELARAYNQHLLALDVKALKTELEQLKAWDIEVSQAEAAGRETDPPSPAFSGRGTEGDPTTALLKLTLAVELDTGIPSPPEEAAERLQVQAQALQDRMGRRVERKTPRELAAAWCKIGPKDTACDPLRERFFTALLALAEPSH